MTSARRAGRHVTHARQVSGAQVLLGMLALAGSVAVLALTRNPQRASAVLSAGVPRAAKSGREGFAAQLSTTVATRGGLVLMPEAVRRLDRVDAVVFDSGPALELAPLFRNFVAAGGVPIPGPLGAGPSRPVVESVASSAAVAMLRVQWPPPLGGAYERTPMLFVAGERDTMIPASGVRALAERYPLAEVHTLPDTEHLQGIKTQPETYAETVLGFLERTLKD